MLYIVLALVLAAFGLLIAALTTANTLWAWLSVIVSVVAAALLVTDWLRGRRRVSTPEPAAAHAPPPSVPDEVDDEVDFDREDRADFEESTYAAPDPAAFEGATVAEPAHTESAARTQEPQGEPGEEPTDASDLLVVSGLGVEVRVVDEHPRYHLASCAWLATRATIPIAVSEARQLGFTPCARCGPDARLAAEYRAAR